MADATQTADLITVVATQHAQLMATIVRDHALRTVNTAIILCENAGQDTVSLDLLRDIATIIAQSPMPSDRKPTDG